MRVMARANVVHIALQVASVQQGSFNQNEVLEYIQSLGPDAELLTANASQDVLDAMTCFVERCTGEQKCDRRLLPSCGAVPVVDRCFEHPHAIADLSLGSLAGSNEHADMAATTEYNVQELAPQLFWTIAVGYMLRSLEVGLMCVFARSCCALMRAPSQVPGPDI